MRPSATRVFNVSSGEAGKDSATFERRIFLSSLSSISLAGIALSKRRPRTFSTSRATCATRAGSNAVAPRVARTRSTASRRRIFTAGRVAWGVGPAIFTVSFRLICPGLSNVNEFVTLLQRYRTHPDVSLQPFREHRNGAASLRQTAGGMGLERGDDALDPDGSARGPGQRHQARQRARPGKARSPRDGSGCLHPPDQDPGRGPRVRSRQDPGSARSGKPVANLGTRYLLHDDVHG